MRPTLIFLLSAALPATSLAQSSDASASDMSVKAAIKSAVSIPIPS